MIALTGYNVLNYLLSRRLVSFEQLAGDRLSFTEDYFPSTLNTNIIVESKGDFPDLFIKQPRSFQVPNHPLQFEEDMIILIQQTEAVSFVPDFIYRDEKKRPRKEQCIDSDLDTEEDYAEKSKKYRIEYDATNHVLILRYILGSVPFLDHLTRFSRRTQIQQRLNSTLKLGQSLFQLHQAMTREGIEESYNKIIFANPYVAKPQNFTPWIIEIEQREIERLKNSNKLFIEKLGIFLCTNLGLIRELREDWHHRQNYLINTDPRLSNIIATTDGDFIFVDWEFSGFASPLWNLAGMVANFLSFLAFENPVLSENEVWGNLYNLFGGYFEKYDISNEEKQELIELTIRYSGLILLQDFYDWASSDFPSGDSANPDKFIIGRACLLSPGLTLSSKTIEGLKVII